MKVLILWRRVCGGGRLWRCGLCLWGMDDSNKEAFFIVSANFSQQL
jgi:hypothetical protein